MVSLPSATISTSPPPARTTILPPLESSVTESWPELSISSTFSDPAVSSKRRMAPERETICCQLLSPGAPSSGGGRSAFDQRDPMTTGNLGSPRSKSTSTWSPGFCRNHLHRKSTRLNSLHYFSSLIPFFSCSFFIFLLFFFFFFFFF